VLTGQAARFGPPLLLDLGALGIRSMERREDSYYIIAGRHGGGGVARLYRWSGNPAQLPESIPGIDFKGLNPEALFFDSAGAYILSDDGKLLIGGVNCEELPQAQRRFRGVRLDAQMIIAPR
jgi:hypothetical protein